MLEKTVEAYLVERVRALGGTAYKFTSPARASVPDRIVILPPGRIYFIEVKRPGGKLTRGQERAHEHLRRLGADVRVLDSIGAINAFLNEVQAVAADGAALDELLQLDVLLANLHAAVWHAGAGDDGPIDFDMAGKDEAKAIQRHVRAMLNARAAVSPATADGRAAALAASWKRHTDVPYDNGDGMSRGLFRAGWNEALRFAASQAAAPAEAREPDAYILPYDLEVLKTYSAQCQVTLYREPRKSRVALYAGRVPADAGEAVAAIRTLRAAGYTFHGGQFWKPPLGRAPAWVAHNTQAAHDVIAERRRQVMSEGWTPAHDDQYTNGELARAASLYAVSELKRGDPPLMWPWPANWWKPTTLRRNLEKAGALILAEIERIDRAEARTAGAQGGKGGDRG